MKKLWWKWIGALILLFSLVMGMWIPLDPGIERIDNYVFNSGKPNWVNLHLYNLENTPSSNTQVILQNNNRMWMSDSVIVEGPLVKARFTPSLGKSFSDSAVYSIWLKVPEVPYLVLKDAVAVNKSIDDTLVANFIKVIPANNPNKLNEVRFPNRGMLQESIRNLLYHVPMWFAMILLLLTSAIYSIKYLNTKNLIFDHYSQSFIKLGLLAGLCGTATGSVWASVTWGAFWSPDPKLNGVTIGMLIYFSYLILRSSIQDDFNRARIASVFNLFVFPAFISLIYIMPKLSTDSLHPGSGETVQFSEYDLDNTLKMVFYPAVVGWTLVFAWMASNYARYLTLKMKINES